MCCGDFQNGNGDACSSAVSVITPSVCISPRQEVEKCSVHAEKIKLHRLSLCDDPEHVSVPVNVILLLIKLDCRAAVGWQEHRLPDFACDWLQDTFWSPHSGADSEDCALVQVPLR